MNKERILATSIPSEFWTPKLLEMLMGLELFPFTDIWCLTFFYLKFNNLSYLKKYDIILACKWSCKFNWIHCCLERIRYMYRYWGETVTENRDGRLLLLLLSLNGADTGRHSRKSYHELTRAPPHHASCPPMIVLLLSHSLIACRAWGRGNSFHFACEKWKVASRKRKRKAGQCDPWGCACIIGAVSGAEPAYWSDGRS